ncbi:protein Smaug homolog 2-like isoform X3 [Eriocheir sinensis]|nr:protein Smaug homolog 2-like isoform X3 [Eriocheir sinensis]XP_050692029.1 protein Smaug homolog 2-like isoform X3 [Eriocheir sinensis]
MGRGLGSGRFRDQVVGLGCLWEAWTEAEQVVVVYSLIRRLPPVPARFLLNLLNHAAAHDPAHDLSTTEANANDPAWVSQLADGKDSGASDLLHHLPLLRPANTDAKMQYLSLIPKVLAQAVASAGSQQSTALENARQLLSYTLIHPAVTVEERRALTHWLRALEERLAEHRRHPPPPPPTHSTLIHTHTHTHPREGFPSATTTTTTTTTTSSSNNTNASNNNSSSGTGGHDQSHSGSLGPAKSRWSSDASVVLPPDTGQTKASWSPALAPWDDMGWCGSVGVSTSLVGSSTGEAPQSPNNSATSSRSSGCESNPEEACQPHPGMRDVGVWLKSLRLHKYSPLLCNLTYDELLALDEATLETQGVTKGARHKIVLSINKLKERHTQLVQIEKEVMSGGHLLSCLNELKAIILTPFPPYTPPADGPPPHPHHHPSLQPQHQQPVNTTALDSLPSTTTTTSTSAATSSTSTSSPSTSSSSSSTVVASSFPSITTAPTSSTTSSLSTSNSSSMCSLRGEEKELQKEDAPRPSPLEPDNSSTIAENDLPSQFTRVMGKVCTQLLVSVRLEDECVSAFLGLVEKCVSHEAFTPTQIRRLQSWKQQIIRVWHPLPPKTKDTRHNRRWSQQYGGDGFLGGSFRVPRVGGQRHTHLPTGLLVGGKAFPTHQTHQLFPLPPAAAAAVSLGGLMSPRNSLPGLPSLGVGGLLSPQQFLAKRPSLQETPSELRPHITLQRTRSAPSRPHQLPLSGPARTGPIPPPPPTTTPSTSLSLSTSACGDLRLPGGSSTVLEPHFSPRASYSHLGPPPSSPDPADNDITDRLESLCLSVTEHALG